MDYALGRIKAQIIDLVGQAIGQEFDHHKVEITVPPSSELGDLAVPCFYFSKLLRRSPNQIAAELQRSIHSAGIIERLDAAGPYLNVTLNQGVLGADVVGEVLRLKARYGRGQTGGTAMIEYSCPNTHKEFHVGHIRNNVLGASLVNIYAANGITVIPVNYIGDIGAHVAKCLWGLEKFHTADQVPDQKGKYLGTIYSEAVAAIDGHPEFKAEADEVLQKLEHGDKHWTALWKKTRAWSLAEFDQIYKLLGITFKRTFYESEVEKPGKKLVEQMLADGLAKVSDGAVVVDLEKYDLKHFLVLKSDGSSLYATKDLALAKLKFDTYKVDRSLHVIDTRQSFYLQQLFKTLELIGLTLPMTHVPYEMVTLKDGAMSSRSGNVVAFEDFYDQVVARAQHETVARHADWSPEQVATVARAIALSAIKFNMLKVGTTSIIVFDIEEALSFDGYSGPYVLYTVTRITSLLAKAGWSRPGRVDYSVLTTALEKELLLTLGSYPEIIATALERNDPSVIAKYVFEISQLYATLYQTLPVLTSDEAIRKARLALAAATRQVLVNGLALLGIEPLDQM